MVSQRVAVRLAMMVGVLGAIAAPVPTLTHEAMMPDTDAQFRTIEQPLPVKLGVTLVGLGLIGAELWWFLLSHKTRPTKPEP